MVDKPAGLGDRIGKGKRLGVMGHGVCDLAFGHGLTQMGTVFLKIA